MGRKRQGKVKIMQTQQSARAVPSKSTSLPSIRVMRSSFKWLVTLAIAAMAAIGGAAHAQTDFYNLEAGATVQDSIGLGLFAKPIPLPEGQWKVVARTVLAIPLVRTSNRDMGSESAGTMPRYVLTLRNTDTNSVMPVIVLSIMGRLTNLSHSAISCPAPTNTVWSDSVSEPGPVFVCATTLVTTNFRSMASQGLSSSNAWVKANLAGMNEDIDKLPNNVTIVDVSGNAYRGFSIKQTYILRQEGNLNDSAYSDYLKPWVHESVLTMRSILKNDAAKLGLPKVFVSSVPVVPGGTPSAAPVSAALKDSIALNDISISNRFDFVDASPAKFRESLFSCIPNYSTKPEWTPLPTGISTAYMKNVYAKIFLLRGTQGHCLNRSVTGFPIFAGDAFLKTVNPVGVPDSVSESWYQRIADNVAKKGFAKVVYVFKNANANVVRYWIDPSKPVEINFTSEMKMAGQWNTEGVDSVFEDPGMYAVSINASNASGPGIKTFPY